MNPPENFPFPFAPYPIQADFMKNLYMCLENKNFGIFESPTGTGKTLSLICGALKWFVDHEEFEKSKLLNAKQEIDSKIKDLEQKSDDWFLAQTEQMSLNKEKQCIESKLTRFLKREEKLNKYTDIIRKHNKDKLSKTQAVNEKWKSKQKLGETRGKDTEITNVGTDDFVDDEVLLKDFDDSESSSDEEGNTDVNDQSCKIFFCSRTHSQLSQFIGEIKKTPYSDKISLVPIASRNNYCINPSVKSLKSINMINEQCIQLQKKKKTLKDEKILKKSKSNTSCPYQPGNQSLLMAEILTSIRDIEDIVNKAEEIKTCPYYSTRKSISDGQLIILPYNSILHKNTRESSGISLKNNILIIDEAHNLLEAIERMHYVTVTGQHLLHCYNQLTHYLKRFEKVLSAKNVLFLSQLNFCIKKLLALLGGNSKSRPTDILKTQIPSRLATMQDFEAAAEIDTINVFELIEFIRKSKLVHKLRTYAEKYEDDLNLKEAPQEKKGVTAFLESLKKKTDFEVKDNFKNNENAAPKMQEQETTNSPLMIVTSFLETLKSSCSDGRIFIAPGATIKDGYLKFQLLNPASHFEDIVKEARAIILAGGTMEPMSEFRDQLLLSAGASSDRIFTFSCDHIVPKENILTTIISSGPTGVEFEFNYQNRQSTKMLDELGRVLTNLCNVVPAGLVIFLPSYNFEELLLHHFEKNGVLAKIKTRKCIFREPKLSSQVNNVLDKYSASIKNPQKPQNGAILFSVVGGKLSEGLNFSDDLGRCIVVVGMPYPNIKSLELQEKMKYLKENVNPLAGKVYYENSCMKAVNQCIGRSIRHINDYSAVVLLDKRFANKKAALPGWIRRTLIHYNNFGNALGNIARFFANKKAKQ